MKSREIVNNTIEFKFPERVARSFTPSDFVWGSPEISIPDGNWVRVGGEAWERKDEWGNTWRRLDPTSKGEVARGAIDDLSLADSYLMPDFSNPQFYQSAKNTFAAFPDHYHIGSIHGLTFSIARKLRRMEQYLMDLVSEPETIHHLHNRIDETIRTQIDQMAAVGADCVMIAEDWGTQLDLLINPLLWRKEYKPRFFNLCAYAHGLGLKFLMHSCGKMTAIIFDLIETGVDVLQFDQPTIHNLDLLAAYQDSSRITFWCPVDIQKTLQTRNEYLIRKEAQELVRKLWRRGGGFIAGFYSDEASLRLEPEWQKMANDEFQKQPLYPTNSIE
jgi:uroporphyrinogen decarboxylase